MALEEHDKGTPLGKQSYPDRLAEDRIRMLREARTWYGNVEGLIAKGLMFKALVSVINACITAVSLNDRENFWLVQRALDILAENGMPVDERMNRQWLKRLRAHVEPDPAHAGRHSDYQTTWEEIRD
jgi:hypothetical protein